MADFLLPGWIIYLVLGLFILALAAIFLLLYALYRPKLLDKVILIDETGRWEMHQKKLEDDKAKIDGKSYYLKEETGLLNKKGKKLFIFSKNKPEPMRLKYNSASWLNCESLAATINNDLIKQIMQLQDKGFKMLQTLGAIGGLIAGIASLIILAKTLNMI